MKKIIKLFALGIFLFTSAHVFAQSGIDTLSIEVKGVCGMCKDRIEKASYIKGVKKATWDNNSSALTVIYKVGKFDEDQLHQSIANIGHSTNKVKASEDAYKRLPKCCSYDDGIEKH